MFQVNAGVLGFVKRAGEDFRARHLRGFTTTKTSLFAKEDMVLDPLRAARRKAAGLTNEEEDEILEAMGFYGFEVKGWTLIVPAGCVAYLD